MAETLTKDCNGGFRAPERRPSVPMSLVAVFICAKKNTPRDREDPGRSSDELGVVICSATGYKMWHNARSVYCPEVQTDKENPATMDRVTLSPVNPGSCLGRIAGRCRSGTGLFNDPTWFGKKLALAQF